MNHSYPSPVKGVVRGRREAAVGIHCRMANVQPSTADADSHSVEAVLVTERAVPMYDHYEGRMFDEVLLASGGRWRSHVPMLDSHFRFSSRETLGSVQDRRRNGFEWLGRLEFVRGDADVDKVWLRVQQGHLRGVSAGYQYEAKDVVRIPPGQTQTVEGRSFTAQDRELRVVTAWTGHEVSVTPVQADEDSHTRSTDGNRENRPVAYQVQTDVVPGAENRPANNAVQTEGRTNNQPREGSRENSGAIQVNPQLLAYLRSLGLSDNATQAEAQALLESLSGSQRAYADSLNTQHSVAATNHSPPAAGATATPAPQPEPPTRQQFATTVLQYPATVDSHQQGQTEERDRVLTIQALGRNVDQQLVARAISEGWTIAQAREQFAPVFLERSAPAQTGQNQEQVRSPSQPTTLQTGTPDNPGQAPGQASRQGPNLRTLQAALVNRTSPQMLQEVDRGRFLQAADVRQALSRCQADWLGGWNRAMLAGGEVPANLQDAARAVDDAWQYRDWHVMDFMRECCRIEGIPVPANRNDLFQRAIGTASAQALFTTNFQVQMLSGFMEVEDTTRGWVYEDDVANWQAKEYVQKGQVSRLTRKPRTAAPDMTTFEVTKEELRVYTYASRWDMTREDAFDDRLGGLDSTPTEMGEAAGEIRPDLVYSLLASNPNLSNGNAAFQTAGADIDNLTTGMAIDEASLNTIETKMATQTNNGRNIQSIPEYLIVARSKAFATMRLLGSQETRNTTASTREGTMNPVRGRYTPVFEPRLDTGFVNPLTDAPVAATPNTFYMSEPARKQKGMAVVYLRADGRNPVTDTYMLTEGRIGMGWSINMVIGAGFIGRHGIAKATS